MGLKSAYLKWRNQRDRDPKHISIEEAFRAGYCAGECESEISRRTKEPKIATTYDLMTTNP